MSTEFITLPYHSFQYFGLEEFTVYFNESASEAVKCSSEGRKKMGGI